MKICIFSSFLGVNAKVSGVKGKEVRCDVENILAEIFEKEGDRKSGIKRLLRGYKVRPDREYKNPSSFRLKKQELINWDQQKGAAIAHVRCIYQPDFRKDFEGHINSSKISIFELCNYRTHVSKNLTRTKIKCLADGRAILEGEIPKCERGCQVSQLGLFSESSSDGSCSAPISGIEPQGSRCKRKCIKNSSIETSKPIFCACNGKFCKYTVAHQGRDLPFNPEPLNKLCEENKNGKLKDHFREDFRKIRSFRKRSSIINPKKLIFIPR